MTVIKIPVAPQWNNSSTDVATPDGGFVYIGSKSINYIGPVTGKNTAAEIKTINTRQNILCLDVDPGWAAKEPEIAKKYVAVLALDNSVQIWDLDLEHAICGHKVHQNAQGIVDGGVHNTNKVIVLLSFMKNRNVLSLDVNDIVNYCVASNTYHQLPNFIPKRNQAFTALRCSPYDDEIFAVGTNRGSVYLCNLKKMQLVYTLRGHDTTITTLKFICTETYSLEQVNQKVHAQNQRQQQPQHQKHHEQTHKPRAEDASTTKRKNPKLKQMKTGVSSGFTAEPDDIFDIYDYDYLENEFGAPPKQSDEVSDFVGFEKPQATAEFDFAEACQTLKQELTGMSVDDQVPETETREVTLEDCKNTNVRCEDTSSCDDGGSSLELIENKSNTSDEGIGDEMKTKQQIRLQADVHATQTLDKVGENVTIMDNTDVEIGSVAAATERNSNNANIKISDVLLASCSLDANIWLWNVRTGASCDNVQIRGTGQRGRKGHIQLSWLNSNKLVASNKNADLCCWLLETPQVHNIKQRYKLTPYKHLFQSHNVVSFDTCPSKELIWTISTNREIKLENFKTHNILGKFGCVSTNISAMRENPHDMNKIALGFSDRRLGIIDLSKLEPNNISIMNYSLRIESLIHCVVWSPDGSKLAFGTQEGRVGIVEVPRLSTCQEPVLLNPICGRSVYSLDWQNNEIFAVCNEMIGVYGDDGRKKHADIIANIKNVSTMSVRSPYLFVGTQNGKLEIYKRSDAKNLVYELLQNFDLAPRYITEISWSSIATNQLAVVANANHVHILSFDFGTGNAKQLHKMASIDNPKASNACVRWSHTDPNKLLTCGFDGSVRVWNLLVEVQPKYEFIKYYQCPIVCGIFMPTNEHVVLCAGKTTSLEMFDLRNEKMQFYVKRYRDPLSSVQWALQAIACTKLKANDTKRMKRQKAAQSKPAITGAVEKNTDGHFEVHPIEIGCMEEHVSNGSSQDVIIVNDQLQQLHIVGEPKLEEELNVSLKDSGALFHKNPASVLCLITKEMNKYPQEKLKQLLKIKSGPKGLHVDTVLSTKLFADKNEAKKILDTEIENHKASASKGVQNIFLPQLTQNLKEEIMKAITQKKLNEWHVSLAPSISYNFWQKATQAFAEQLIEQGYALQAATYMISLHKHTDAINMLADGRYFKEAMLVARIYVAKDDPLIANILDKWLTYLDSKGNLFTAAFVCALANDIERSMTFISKVSNRTNEIDEIIDLMKVCIQLTPA